MGMTPEQKARVSIDALIEQAGWHVCNVSVVNIHAETGVATFQLRYFAADRDAYGLRIVEIFNWFVKTLMSSVALLQRVKARPELAKLFAAEQ